MNFTHSDADIGTIIKSYSNNENNYEIKYLDGSTAKYYCSGNETDKIRNKMINQAIERDKKYNISIEQIKRAIMLVTSFTAALGTSVFNSNNEILLGCISLAILFYSIYNSRKLKIKILELKKYKMYLDAVDDLPKINMQFFLKRIEQENIYHIPFDIEYLDEYSYKSVKMICKKINKQK